MSITKQSITIPPEAAAETRIKPPRRSTRRRPRRIKAWLFGIAAGVIFVALEAVFGLYPPSAYGFCLSCHTRDLINTIVNRLAGTSWGTAALSGRVLLLTSPAVLAGALIAARAFKEHRVKKAEKPLRSFIYGFIIMIIGILIFGCPTRLLLRTGYGDVYAIAGVLAMYTGVTLSTLFMRMRIGSRL